jgi:hypothetical protein
MKLPPVAPLESILIRPLALNTLCVHSFTCAVKLERQQRRELLADEGAR